MAGDVRDLGYLAWKNDLGWMESQKGDKWDNLVKEENMRFQNSMKGLNSKQIEADFLKDTVRPWKWRGWTIKKSLYSPEQTWSYKSFECKAWDADISQDFKYFAAAIPDKKGYERFTISIYSINTNGLTLKHTIEQCGPYVAFLNDTLVYLGSSKDLRYDSVFLNDIQSKNTTRLYELSDETENIRLGRGQDGSVYVCLEDFVNVRLGFVIGDSGIHWLIDKANDISVVQFNAIIINGSGKCFGIDEYLESLSFKGGWAVTRSYGIRTLWNISGNEPKEVMKVWGEILFDSRDPYSLDISDIRYKPYTISLPEWSYKREKYNFQVIYSQHPAPAFTVVPEGKVKGLLVSAYGAYGSPTHSGSIIQRWAPLLMRGWAIASVCVPGSGDHDFKWKMSGQRQSREFSIDTFRKKILNLQEEYGIPSTATCLYGRSAGGLLVISTAIKYRGLVGALYVESPYVDVLRTISNPALPLTALETKEFGIGTNPTNILATAAWSPMEHIPDEGIPEIFVVARSDTSDLEVYPYEVVKWIVRMRGDERGEPKLLYVHKNKGHFTTSQQTRAEDMALLDEWVKQSPDRDTRKKSALRVKNRSTKYKMAVSRKNRSRKNRSRKNKNNAPAMGGRRGSKAKSTRRGRKGSRRN